MRIAKVAAAAVLSTAALGIAAATAHGEASVATVPVVSSVDHGVEYTAAVAPDRSSATVTLAAGKFVMTPAGISVQAPDGSLITTVPTTVQTVSGQQVRVAPEIDAAATTLTLNPIGAAAPEPGAPQFIGDAGTTVAGVLIGCAIGFLIGLIFAIIGAVPGCVIGGIIGGIAGANQP
ncbi:hypothetical protein [Nocardia pseudobrasiliensis]|uniref:DUF8020 domain-containing protein n=1 Tax=Nocardia pseudobrasiliensis TaxID=45979 RepID=A0A370I8L8_9NOCA|nr:hypothetical protein [Nocardia pseudobrasiliensis]RDI67087.1 hypothetical protein DFR76_103158 [Nocardia pseudobrasiliensis]